LLTPTFLQFSGIDRVVELNAEELAKKNEVTIFSLKAGIKPKNKKIKVIEMGMPKNPFLQRIYRLLFFLDFSKIKKYGKMLKDYDVAVSHQYPINLIALYAKKHYKTKYVYHNHGVAFPYLFKNPLERIYMESFKIISNMSIKNVDTAISISRFLQKELKKETGIDSKVVYDPIDKKRFHKNVNGKKIREKYKLGKDPVCLYVGRISPHKGIHLLIEAFNLVLKEIPNAKLLIAGKPTFDNYFKKLRKLGNKSVIFAGFVADEKLADYYAACDVYTTATLWEGFNMTVAEAQACGKPVVAFNLCSHPEVVKKGILVKPNNTEEFARAIIKLLKKKK